MMPVSYKQKQAIAVLLGGGTNHEAAAASGVRHETVCRWKQQCDFATELDAGQARLQSAVQYDLAVLHEKALARIADALDDDEVGVRLRAASLVVSRSVGHSLPSAIAISNNVSVGSELHDDGLTIEEAYEHIECGPTTVVYAVSAGVLDLAEAQAHLTALADATAEALAELEQIQKASIESPPDS